MDILPKRGWVILAALFLATRPAPANLAVSGNVNITASTNNQTETTIAINPEAGTGTTSALSSEVVAGRRQVVVPSSGGCVEDQPQQRRNAGRDGKDQHG
jgi:hypothetical protein